MVKLLFLFLSELQLNLLPIYQILGQEGYALHRSLCDINGIFSKKDLGRNKQNLFDMNELITEMISCSSCKFSLQPFFDATQVCSDSNKSSEEKDDKFPQEAIKSAIHDVPSSEFLGDRQYMLDNLCSTATAGDILLAMLQHGSNSSTRNSGDFAAYWCMYAICCFAMKIEKSEETQSNVTDEKRFIYNYSRQCLLQCLTISNQAMSPRMSGWFDYGSVTEINYFAGQPFSILQQLAYDCARDQKWADAESVCRAMVICCEQHLPLHHPTTLTSLIDLSMLSAMNGNQSFADNILHRAAERLSKYLFGMESSYTSHLSKARSSNKPGQTLFRIEHGRDAIFELHAFASLFQRQLKRDMVSLIGADNGTVSANHCFVADTLSVLANCTAAAHFFLGSTSEESNDCGRLYWRMAYRHYELCYTILSTTKHLDNPFVVRSLFGVARCLREFGETENALKLLSVVVSFKSSTEEKPNSDTSDSSQADISVVEESKGGDNGTTNCTPRFLPVSSLSNIGADVKLIPKSMLSALCLWLMSILSVDAKGDEEGRERAFGYLHAASLLLQASLHKASDACDDATRAMCIRFLSMIEDEAELISEPMYE